MTDVIWSTKMFSDAVSEISVTWCRKTRFLPQILGKQLRKIEMNKSYRNTVEIAEYARTLVGMDDAELLNRHGKAVAEREYGSKEEMISHILEHVKIGPEGYETAAVLTMTEAEAREWYEMIRKKTDQVHYIDRDSSRFGRGLTVTTFYMAKGLEFDQVFTVAHKEETKMTRQAEYICATERSIKKSIISISIFSEYSPVFV